MVQVANFVMEERHHVCSTYPVHMGWAAPAHSFEILVSTDSECPELRTVEVVYAKQCTETSDPFHLIALIIHLRAS